MPNSTHTAEIDFNAHWQDFCDENAARGDKGMSHVYVGGVAYSIAEYAAMLFESAKALNGFVKVSAPLFPLWNFFDAVGVTVDAGKNRKAGDDLSANINYFSGAQLFAGTSLGIVVRALEEQTTINPAISMVGGLTISAGAFALCMFCSAIVAQIKASRLTADLADLDSNKNVEKILNKVVRRNPNMKHLQSAYSKATKSEKDWIKTRLKSAMQAELAYQQKAVNTWLICGIAMVGVTLMVFTPGSILLVATCVLMAISAYMRYRLRESEQEQNKAIHRESGELVLSSGKYTSTLRNSEDNNNNENRSTSSNSSVSVSA